MNSAVATSTHTKPAEKSIVLTLVPYLLTGMFFGIVLIKSEVVSWYRIQEMFRFQSFHMYGIIGSAVVVAAISLQFLKRLNLRDQQGNKIRIDAKPMGRGINNFAGGLIFGLGWALTGACPGPLYALLGFGIGPVAMIIFSALVGAWVYGYLRPHLPH